MADMAAPELARVEVEGLTRASFVLRGALATGAVFGAGAVGPFVARSFAATPPGDIEVLQFALGLENLEAGFYKAALKQAKLSPRVKEIATEFGAHEAEHAKALSELITALGSKPNAPAKTKFPSLSDEKAFLETAVTLEEVGISAYNGAAPALVTPDLIEAAGGIVAIEARHAGALRMLAGQDPAPAAFDEALTPQKVTERVKSFLAS